MRQIGTVPDARAARTFTDYLTALKIEARLDHQAQGWALWVFDEDRVQQARAELEQFLRNPDDPRYVPAASPPPAAEDGDEAAGDEAEPAPFDWSLLRRLVTVALAVGCVAVFIASDFGTAASPVVQALQIAPDGDTNLEHVCGGELWRLVSPIFLHFSFWHLLFNLVMLYDLGRQVEQRRGAVRYLLLVLVIAIASNVAQFYLGAGVWHIGTGAFSVTPSGNFGGMSGVLYGLFGYIWVKTRCEPELGFELSSLTIACMVAWLCLCLLEVIPVPVANVCHGAGLFMGLLLGYVTYVLRAVRQR
jgi:GlpG protein